MSSASNPPSDRDQQLNEAIAAYLEAIERGESPSQQDWLARHPDLAPELRQFFSARFELDRFVRWPRPLSSSDGRPAEDSPVAEPPFANDIDRAAATMPPSDPAASAPAPSDATPDVDAGLQLSALNPQPFRVRYFGDYELLSEIARGGMGVVYKARQVSLNRIVAVKMILAGQLAGPDDVRRFRTEAEAAAQLQHPNIVAIHEVGEHEGQHYFSMDYVEGTSLAALVRENPLPAKQAAAIVKTVAEAIHYAHQKGILHRDLKPSNVLMQAESGGQRAESQKAESEVGGQRSEILALSSPLSALRPRVTDFGLAKRIEGGSELTGTGQILGTPSYMPPEQAGAKRGEIGPASDVYSLGAILYELLTGRPPFRAETPLDTLLQVLDSEPVAPRLLNPKIDRDLETITLKCLEKESGRRYRTALALANDLEHWLNHRPIQARRSTVWERSIKWGKRRPAVAALTLGLILAGVLGFTGITWQWRIAVSARRGAEDRLVRNYVANGVRLMEEGDMVGSLPWFAEALSLEHDDRVREAVHRYRFGVVLRQCPRLAQVWFHKGRVNHAEFSPDGRYVVTASDDRTAGLWDVTTGQPVCTPLDAQGQVKHASFSTDGKRVVTAGSSSRVWDATTGSPVTQNLETRGYVNRAVFSPDGRTVLTAIGDWREGSGRVQVWDAATGKPVTPPMKHDLDVHYAEFSRDGRYIVTATRDNTGTKPGEARVWDAKTGEPVTPTIQHDKGVSQTSFSPDGSRIVTACSDGAARVWDAKTGEPITPPMSHGKGYVSHVAFSPDGRHVVTASSDQTARVWDAATGEPLGSPLQHTAAVSHASFSPDGSLVATASYDRTARVWDASSGAPKTPPLNHGEWVVIASFDRDATRLVTASYDKMVRVWDLSAIQQPPRVLKHDDHVHLALFSPNGRCVLTDSNDQTARVWDATTGEPVTPSLQHSGPVRGAAFSPDGNRIVTMSGDSPERTMRSHTRVWDANSGNPLTPVKAHTVSINDISFSPDGKYILTASTDRSSPDKLQQINPKHGEARIWDASNWEPVIGPMSHDGSNGTSVENASFSRDGSRVVTTGGGDDTARVWDAVTGQAITPPMKHDNSVTHAAFSLDGRFVATASSAMDFGAALVWDARTGKQVTPPMKTNPVNHLSFSPDGRRIITASTDQTARVWDAKTGEPVTPPLRHSLQVNYAAFSPDGCLVLTVSDDHTARVWDARTGQPVTPPLRHADKLKHGSFSPDGRRVATASCDGTARVWDLDKDERPWQELALQAHMLSAHQIDATGGLVPADADVLAAQWAELRQRRLDSSRRRQ